MSDMRRRQFITLIGGAAAAWPLAARAQEDGRIYRLGFLLPSARQTPAVEAFFDELRLNGFIEGKNLVVVPGFEATDNNLAERAAGLVNAAPDAIVAGPAPPLRALQAITRTVPIVGMSEDMVGERLAASLGRQHHRHQSALPRTRRQTAGHFDRGGARRAPDRSDGRFQADPAVSPSSFAARGALARRGAFGFRRQRA
jgi:hypothetical protein